MRPLAGLESPAYSLLNTFLALCMVKNPEISHDGRKKTTFSLLEFYLSLRQEKLGNSKKLLVIFLKKELLIIGLKFNII